MCRLPALLPPYFDSYFLFTFMGEVPQEPLRTVLRILGDVTASS
jgi:hypothetical protein